MKKIIGFSFLYLISFSAFPQLNLEYVYNVSASITQLEDNGYKYYVMDVANNQCRLYNPDHSLWKTIQLAVPEGDYLYNIQYVSDKLFNTDSNVELSYTYYSYNDSAQYYVYETRVITESGNVLITIPGASYIEVKVSGPGTYKYLAYVWDYSVIPYTVQTWVYSVPGRLLSVDGPPGFTSTLQPPFPNPGTTEIHIPYNLPEGVTEGVLYVYNSNGQLIKSYEVDRNFAYINVGVGDLPKGMYIAKLHAGSTTNETYKFIVN
jgi:hypothetical protein